VDHCLGAALSLVVFGFTAPIASLISGAVSSASARLSADGSTAFVAFELTGSLGWSLLGMALLGLMVAGFDRLVVRRLIRPWVPPLAVRVVAMGTIALLAPGEMGWQGRAAIGAGLGGVVGLGFATWWFAGMEVARLRGRGRTPRRIGERPPSASPHA
jgi:hypothetical protein